MRLAEEKEVDLVEIAPTAQPPVCRLMDYGKFKYQEQKKAHEAKLKQKIIQVKEVKFRPGTDEGDYAVKLRNLQRFLEDGDKTKITLRFRGRELAHIDEGMKVFEQIRTLLAEVSKVDQNSRREGRRITMTLAPGKSTPAAAPAPAAAKPASQPAPAPQPAAPKPVQEPAPAASAPAAK